MRTKTHVKLNISLPADVHAWCKKKWQEEKKKTRIGTVAFSNIIAHAIKEIMDQEPKRALSKQGKDEPQPHGGSTQENGGSKNQNKIKAA